MEYIFIADCKFVLSFVFFVILSKWLMPLCITFFLCTSPNKACFVFCMSANISTVLSALCVFIQYVTFLYLFSGVLGKAQTDPLAELQ